jgi:hypothetical protein
MIETVRLLSVGTSASEKIPMSGLAKKLSSKVDLNFVVLDTITVLPLPEAPAPSYTTSSQYKRKQIFKLVRSAQDVASNAVTCSSIDHEVYRELFSTVDKSGEIIVVSLRNSTLHEVIRAANSTLEQYFLLEMSLQLLAIQYRDSYNIAPGSMLPWHLDRRRCLFDYFGLSPEDTAKLDGPRLCDECKSKIEGDHELKAFYRKIQDVLKLVTERRLAFKLRRFFGDPIVSFLSGALIGVIPALFNKGFSVVAAAAVILILMIAALLTYSVRGALNRAR